MQTNERELKLLLVKGLAGDNAAYRLFLGKVSALLRQFVSRRLFRLRRSAQDNEDILQQALIAIHSKRNTYDGETPVTAWIYGIARYKLIDSLRASNADVNFADLDEMAGAIEDAEKSEARLVVWKAMSLLPETLRVPIELMKLQGLSAGEAALQTGTSEVTVRVNVHRGLKALARYCGVQGTRNEDR
jgi:RNA polymerase sigma-70 factor (ECF subfamily)